MATKRILWAEQGSVATAISTIMVKNYAASSFCMSIKLGKIVLMDWKSTVALMAWLLEGRVVVWTNPDFNLVAEDLFLCLWRIMLRPMLSLYPVDIMGSKTLTSTYYHLVLPGLSCIMLRRKQCKLFSFTTFRRHWQQLTPYILISKPASDLCFVCKQNNTFIMR